jgi:alpha-glucoside transport system substrate-binding protein
MEYFTLPASASGWLQNGGALAAHQTATPDMYGVELEKGIATLVSEATSFRFDGSDLMPGEVGAGSFWKGMTDWVSGAADLDTVLSEIDASWPEGVSGEVSGPAEEGIAAPPGGSLEKALAGEFAGTEVSVMGVMVEEDGLKFEQSFAPFEEATGIDVVYEGTKEFEAAIGIRVDADDPPDVADFPQPGLLASFARQGKVIDVSQYIDMGHLQGNYSQGWLDMATMPGLDGDIMSGVWHRTAGKSFIWYPKQAFEAAGYEVPTTWDELLALTQQIADDGDTAWCIGIESGVATGWVATDWMENIMLRTTTPENYDKWVSHELPFTSPEVKNAAETMAEIWLNEDYVYGGTAGIVSIFIGDSPVPMFEDPPQCWFHAQAPWITGFFGEGLESGVDYEFFTMPPIDATYGTPVLVAGDLMAAFDDRPEVLALMNGLASAPVSNNGSRPAAPSLCTTTPAWIGTPTTSTAPWPRPSWRLRPYALTPRT